MIGIIDDLSFKMNKPFNRNNYNHLIEIIHRNIKIHLHSKNHQISHFL